jgi:tRNA-specific 2-thiouridylase
MDMSKKIQETYLPERESRKSRIVIGLSGGLNSMVVAYLLKIQKYDLMGVTISMNWDNYPGQVENSLSCHLSTIQIDKIKDFCHQLGIPHFVVKGSDEFKDVVIDSWMSSRLTGTKSNHCLNCHELRMKLLYQKMVELEAQGLATGHMAKIFKHEAHGSVYVHSSNDEASDQSTLLSRLPHDILNKLILPLSDLQQKEIDKLAENFGISHQLKKVNFLSCIDSDKDSLNYLELNVPKRYKDSGEVVAGVDKAPAGDHQGVYQFTYAQDLPVQGQRQNEVFKLTKYHFKEKKIEVLKSDFFQRKKIFLNHCRLSDETPWHEPLSGFIKLDSGDFVSCFIYPKNNSSALVELERPEYILEGEIVTLFRKKGKNAKVFLTGQVRYVQEEPQLEEGNERAKVDYSRDY